MLAQHVAVQRPWSAVPIGAGMVQFARGVRSGVITRVGSPDGISVCADVHVLSDHQIIPWTVYHFSALCARASLFFLMLKESFHFSKSAPTYFQTHKPTIPNGTSDFRVSARSPNQRALLLLIIMC